LDENYTMARYEAMLRADFTAFAHRAFCELNPRAAFAMNWHCEAIAAKLTAVYQRRVGRLMICVPPRYLKSLLASVVSSLVPGSRSEPAVPLRQLCPGPRRQARARLPPHHDERLVPAAFPKNPAVAAAPGGAGV
jgi:hypothetical protein